MKAVVMCGCLCAVLSLGTITKAEPIAVKRPQGATRGFLVVRSEAGKLIGSGELSQSSRGDEVTTRLTFKFFDGSLDDETTTFSQRGTFKLIRDHHIQKGPFFEKPVDITVDVATGTVTSRSIDHEEKDGKPKVETEHMDMPDDLANGFIGILLLNIPSDAAPFKVSYLAPSGKGRMVKLAVFPAGQEPFRVAGRPHRASVFRIHIELGGITGVVAPLIGKEPKDVMVSVIEGEVPALVHEVGQLAMGGPVVSIELAGSSFAKVGGK